MINTKIEGVDLLVGIPCSKLQYLTNKIKPYIPCTREDEAVAIAVGTFLAGKKPLVFMQNSGLGNCVDIITSLLKPYNIKIPFIISNRKKPLHHKFMGQITESLIRLLKLEKYILVEK